MKKTLAANSADQPAPKKGRGKGRPFPKGVSGNPSGRPASEREVVDACRQVGAEMVRLLTKSARKGNTRAQQEILNRGYGKARQVVRLEGDADKPIAVKVKNADPRHIGELLGVLDRTGLLPQPGSAGRADGGAHPPDDAVHGAGADATAGGVPPHDKG